MEKEYYQPTIEEFHIGFEFEFLTGSKEWKPFIFEENRCEALFDNFKKSPQSFRVKLLDSFDITSEGFFFTKVIEYDQITWSHFEGNSFGIAAAMNNHFRIVSLKRDGFPILFDGCIKNRSQLRIIIKQLIIRFL